MKKLNKEELLSELNDIYKQGVRFFKNTSKNLDGVTYSEPVDRPCEKDEFWNNLSQRLQNKATSLISRVIEIAPLIAESTRMTPYLTDTDQIDLGHAIKGMRAALRLRRYSYWAPDVLHDEGIVLGVQPAGQSDDEGIFPDDALKIFQDCYQRVTGIIELVNPLTIKHAERHIEATGQISRYQPDTALIMMWIDPRNPELEDIYTTVKRCFNEFGITSERADEIEHDGLISEKIIEKIKSSEFLYADLTGERPNVYYEVGYAHAIRKRVLLYRKTGEKIHFDLSGYNCPEYNNLTDLEAKLKRRLSHITGSKVKREPSESE